MKCKNNDEAICFYDELTDADRKRLDDHLVRCESCRVKLQTMQELKRSIALVAPVRAELRHPGRMTRSVMNAVRALERRPTPSLLTVVLNSMLTRVAFAAASLIFTGLFFYEQGDVIAIPGVYADVNENQKQVTLNTPSMLKTMSSLRREKDNRKIISIYACVKAGDCNKNGAKNFIN